MLARIAAAVHTPGLRSSPMMTFSPDSRSPSFWSARTAALVRSRPPDDPELLDARDALRYWRVRRALDPELDALSPANRRRLADLLLEGVSSCR